MSEQAVVADTSALIHFMEGHLPARKLLFGAEIHISVATEIELLTMSEIKRTSAEVIHRTLAHCSVWDVGPAIKDHCVRLRSQYRMKLADALIAATAVSLGLPLATSDKGFARLKAEVELKWL